MFNKSSASYNVYFYYSDKVKVLNPSLSIESIKDSKRASIDLTSLLKAKPNLCTILIIGFSIGLACLMASIEE